MNKGGCFGLLGENGAGKSTLIKILIGIHTPTSGEIFWKGELLKELNPDIAGRLGIAAVHQELTLVDTLSIGNNIFLGNEPKNKYGLVDMDAIRSKSQELLKQIEMDLDVNQLVGELQLADKQMIEIAKALAREPDMLILDEGTSALTEDKVEIVHRIVQQMKAQGKTVILITHRMKEVFQFCDLVTVLKDGIKVGDRNIADLNEDMIVEMMSGVQTNNSMPAKFDAYDEEIRKKLNQVILEVRDLSVIKKLKNVNLTLHTGEVLGIGGLQGHGQVDLINTLFGIEKISHGEIIVDGTKRKISHPWDAVKNGLFLVPQNRRTEGLFVELPVAENIGVNALQSISCFGVINGKKEKQIIKETIANLQVKLASESQLVKFLSGGNQQKIALGKWLKIRGRILMMIEPTRGIDVKTKSEIYNIIRGLAMDGYGILIVSSEMHELIGLSDRIAVFYENEIIDEFAGTEINDVNILNASFGKRVGSKTE